MRLGAQISTAGGVYKAFERGHEVTCETIMVFTKSNRQWQAKPLTEDDVEKYKAAEAEYSHIYPVAAHASYLINACSPKKDLWDKSYAALLDEVQRAAALGIPIVTFHPGSYVGCDEATGLDNLTRALKRVLAETAETAGNVTICLETMAGTGETLGHRFEHLAHLLEAAGPNSRLDVCLDTCHVFAAGYDIRTPEAYEQTMAEFDRLVGLDHLKCFHFNDSKYDLGERRDRHEHIGRGYIGLEGFANFVNDPRWADHPAHLETPKTETDDEGNEIEMDPVNLAALRELIR